MAGTDPDDSATSVEETTATSPSVATEGDVVASVTGNSVCPPDFGRPGSKYFYLLPFKSGRILRWPDFGRMPATSDGATSLIGARTGCEEG